MSDDTLTKAEHEAAALRGELAALNRQRGELAARADALRVAQSEDLSEAQPEKLLALAERQEAESLALRAAERALAELDRREAVTAERLRHAERRLASIAAESARKDIARASVGVLERALLVVAELEAIQRQARDATAKLGVTVAPPLASPFVESLRDRFERALAESRT